MTTEKKRKLEHDIGTEIGADDSNTSEEFKSFRIVRILNENPQQKSIFIHGKFDGRDDDAVVILEKSPFNEDNLRRVFEENPDVKLTLNNDIYKTYELYPRPELNGIKTTVIYPATEKHFTKYSSHAVCIVNETPEDYRRCTLPYIESSALSLKWVYNILEKRSESDRIVFEDADPSTGFILLPDMKWNRKQINDLYLVAIVHDRSLRSLRDLNGQHLPLLVNIRDRGTEAIESQFGVSRSQLRVYVHYQPSYYHFHVHFTHLAFDAPGTYAGRAHLLNDIIDNIQLMADFYVKKTLTFVVRENEQLYELYRAANTVHAKSSENLVKDISIIY